MALRLYGNIWHAYFRDENGRLRTLSTHETDKAAAAKIDRKIRAMIRVQKSRKVMLEFMPPEMREKAIQAGVESNILPLHKKNRLKLSDMFELAGTYRKLSDDHRKRWNFFLNHIELKYADEITPKIARDFLRSNFGSGNGKNYNNYLTALNTIFRLCLIDAGMERSPFAELPRMRVTDVQHYRPLTEEEFILIFDNANIRWKTLCLIGWHTGQRFETCIRILKELAIKDVENITILPGKTARFGRSVFIPLHQQIRDWFNHLRKTYTLHDMQSWSFETRRDPKSNDRYFANLLKDLNICDNSEGKASFHSFRSSFITRCDEEEIDRKATRGIVGQVSDDTTDLYSHDKESAKKILSLPPAKICM